MGKSVESANVRDRWLVGALLGVLLPLVLSGTGVSKPPVSEVRVLSAIGMRLAIVKLGAEYERTTGNRLLLAFDSGAVIVKRILDGEAADVVLIPRAGVEQLVRAKRISLGPVDLATSRVGVAVRTGSPRPDISTPAALTRTLLAARTIAVPDPALGGSSGVHLARVFEKIGIASRINDRLVLSSTPQDESTLPGARVAAGHAELALHQMQELKAVAGIDIVGPLPDALQETFMFSGAILRAAAQPHTARSLLDFLQTPAAAATLTAIGMDPVRRY